MLRTTRHCPVSLDLARTTRRDATQFSTLATRHVSKLLAFPFFAGWWGEDLTVAVNLLRQKKREVPQEFELSVVRLIGLVLSFSQLVRQSTNDGPDRFGAAP
jgi:hypothetical protein